ncbi:hypothetical protein FGB62_85g03 [Gracilaria domingensis]|nr:hypothetical protein FGB62_85g03 [Gracilaria domingensis]
MAVVERFLKSCKYVASILASKDSEAAEAYFDALTTKTNGERDVVHPALEAILESQLRQIGGGMAKTPDYEVPQILSQQFTKVVISFLSKIEAHSLWIAGSLLHPRMRSLGFFKNSSKRNASKNKGFVPVKRLLRNYVETDKAKDVETPTFNDSVAPKGLGAQSFCLFEMFDIAESNDGQVDAYDEYMIRKFPL